MCVGLAPKNMARYVEELRARGIVEAVYEASRLRLYRINPRLRSLLSILRSKLGPASLSDEG